jgi:hypothetical protein
MQLFKGQVGVRTQTLLSVSYILFQLEVRKDIFLESVSILLHLLLLCPLFHINLTMTWHLNNLPKLCSMVRTTCSSATKGLTCSRITKAPEMKKQRVLGKRSSPKIRSFPHCKMKLEVITLYFMSKELIVLKEFSGHLTMRRLSFLFIFTKNNIRFLSDAGFILLLYFTYCWLT